MKWILIAIAFAPVFVFAQSTGVSYKIVEVGDSIRQVTITNLLGRIIFSQSYSGKKISVHVPAIPNGLYIVNINGLAYRKYYAEGAIFFNAYIEECCSYGGDVVQMPIKKQDGKHN